MARAESTRNRIGDMLVAAGLVTSAQVDEALSAQGASRLPLGKQLVAMGYLSEVQLTQLLSNQLSVPWVSLERVEFSEELLARVPGELADSFCVMPIYIRTVRHQGATLYIAMDDPTHEEALRRVSLASGLPVKPMIASPSDIRRAIEEHYFGALARSANTNRTPHMPTNDGPAERAGEPPERAEGPTPHARGKPPPPPAARPGRADGTVPVERYEMPSAPPPGKRSRVLTLLDGTTVALPSAGTKVRLQEATNVRHVIKAIRAANADLGVDAPPRWHDVVQVMLNLLNAKGVRLTRKELAEAWARQQEAATSKPK